MSVPEAEIANTPTAAAPCTPRRKRRRTTATGAANDCFTCANQNASCDRKRPYCSPCLDGGKDCAGYKTTLTWGVGVASRGKLRGLSLPIAGNKPKPSARLRTLPLKGELVKSEPPRRRSQKLGTTTGSVEPFTRSPTFSATDYPDQVMFSLLSTWQSAPSAACVAMPAQLRSGQDGTVNGSSPDSFDDPLHSSRSDQAMLTSSSTSGEAYSEEYFGPIAGPSQMTSYLRGMPSPQRSRSYSLNATEVVRRHHAELWSAKGYYNGTPSPDISEESCLGTVQYATVSNGPVLVESPQTTPGYSQIGIKAEPTTRAEKCQELEGCKFDIESANAPTTASQLQHTALMLSPFSGGQAIGRTPRMRYLINYYSEVISPVIVAFDGPTNPYRSYILRLASGSETLQHAISALSASNLRQRRESGELSTGKTDPARRSSMAHQTLTDPARQSAPGMSVEDQRKEENYHKNATVHLIQRQFADPSQHRDDSVLATLLIVCLFHICESGVAKFKTHFAGAKKLLGMRDSGSMAKSKEAKWFTRMFTWFDAMTATVNDREGQMQGGLLDLSSLSDEDWSLENLAGCDGKLFKIIANLSRLNILSQSGVIDSPPLTASCSTPMILPNPSYWNTFSGNGWTTTTIGGTYPVSDEMYPDINTQYGREWHETRNALISWTLDISSFGSGRPDVPALSQDQQLDLMNISESFRCSALIYMERLALPHVSSSDRRIQMWVQKALYFIKLVRSDVYLLWPLFVTGSECVTEFDRHVVRQRCLDIQKDSGFSNNASCLKLLEKIWASSPNAPGVIDQPSGFKWRSVMESDLSGGEYIVV